MSLLTAKTLVDYSNGAIVKKQTPGQWLFEQSGCKSQCEMARRADIEQSNMNKLILGKSMISPYMAVRLCKPFNICPYELLHRQVEYVLSMRGIKKKS